MAYGLYTASYGNYNSGRQVSITDVANGLPALILASASGGIVTNTGLTKLDNNGNLAVYIDLDRTWRVEVFEETFRENTAVNTVRMITVPEITTIVGELGVTYVVKETNAHYYWNGAELVPFPNRFQLEALNSLYNQVFASFTYGVGGKLESYIRDGIAHTVTYNSPTQITISNVTGTTRTVNLDNTGKVIAIL
jgi:hypothetical protein